MKIITAKILDPTHLELSQPISTQPGEVIHISIPDEPRSNLQRGEGEEDRLWQEEARKRFLEAYGDEDAIYDKL